MPSGPHCVQGVEQGSDTTKKYALRDSVGSHIPYKAARAYLDIPHTEGVLLRANILRIFEIMKNHLQKNVQLVQLMSSDADQV